MDGDSVKVWGFLQLTNFKTIKYHWFQLTNILVPNAVFEIDILIIVWIKSDTAYSWLAYLKSRAANHW